MCIGLPLWVHLCVLFSLRFFPEGLKHLAIRPCFFVSDAIFSGRLALFTPAEHHAHAREITSFYPTLHAAQAQGAQIGTGRGKALAPAPLRPLKETQHPTAHRQPARSGTCSTGASADLQRFYGHAKSARKVAQQLQLVLFRSLTCWVPCVQGRAGSWVPDPLQHRLQGVLGDVSGRVPLRAALL